MDSKPPADKAALSSTAPPADPTTSSNPNDDAQHLHGPPAYADHTDHKPRQPSRRPGEDLMESGDPSTAALRAWAHDKQMQVPGTDGSFALGKISGGAGAVSGGPMFLPRKEFIVEPPMHEVDRLRKEEEEGEMGKAGEEGGRKRRGSVKDFFRRLSRGREEHQGEGGEGEGAAAAATHHASGGKPSGLEHEEVVR